jgi:hypothetical protein
LSDDERALPFKLSFWDGDHMDFVLLGSGWEPSWHWRVINNIQRLAALAPNWDSYGAEPLRTSAARRCITSVLMSLPDDTPEPTVVPTREGGLQLEWRRSGVEFEIAVPPEGPITYLLVDDQHPDDDQEWEGAPQLHAKTIADAIKRLASIG